MPIFDYSSLAMPDGISLEVSHNVERSDDVGYNYTYLTYAFNFPSGRKIEAISYLESHAASPSLAFHTFHGDGVDPEQGFSQDCVNWPEFRLAVLSAMSFGFKDIECDALNNWAAVLNIQPVDVEAWADAATDALTTSARRDQKNGSPFKC